MLSCRDHVVAAVAITGGRDSHNPRRRQWRCCMGPTTRHPLAELTAIHPFALQAGCEVVAGAQRGEARPWLSSLVDGHLTLCGKTQSFSEASTRPDGDLDGHSIRRAASAPTTASRGRSPTSLTESSAFAAAVRLCSRQLSRLGRAMLCGEREQAQERRGVGRTSHAYVIATPR